MRSEVTLFFTIERAEEGMRCCCSSGKLLFTWWLTWLACTATRPQQLQLLLHLLLKDLRLLSLECSKFTDKSHQLVLPDTPTLKAGGLEVIGERMSVPAHAHRVHLFLDYLVFPSFPTSCQSSL